MESFNSFENISNLTSLIGLPFNLGSNKEIDTEITSAKDQQENNPRKFSQATANEEFHESSSSNIENSINFDDHQIKQRQKINEANLKVISGHNFSSVDPNASKRIYVPGSFDHDSQRSEDINITTGIVDKYSSLFSKQDEEIEISKTLTLGDLNTSISTKNFENLDIFNDDRDISNLSNDLHSLLQKNEMSFSTIILDPEVDVHDNFKSTNGTNNCVPKRKPGGKKGNKKSKNGKRKNISSLSTVGELPLFRENITDFDNAGDDLISQHLPKLQISSSIDHPQQGVVAIKTKENDQKPVNSIFSTEANIIAHGIQLKKGNSDEVLDLSNLDEPITNKCAPFLGEYDYNLDERIMIDILNYEIQKLSNLTVEATLSQKIIRYLMKIFKPNHFREKNLWDQFSRNDDSNASNIEISQQDSEHTEEKSKKCGEIV